MREHITNDIQAAIADIEAQLSQLDALRKRKQVEIRQLQRALKLVDADPNPAAGRVAARVTPITAAQKTPGTEA